MVLKGKLKKNYKLKNKFYIMNPNFRTCCVLHFILLASHLSTKQYLIRLAIYWLIQFSGCEGDSTVEGHDELKHKY